MMILTIVGGLGMAEDYFHIAPKIVPKWSLFPALKVGDTIKTGDFNPFFNFFLSSNLPTENVNVDGEVSPWSWMQFLAGIRFGTMNTSMGVQDIATRGHYLAMHFCKYTRELIWESVRATHYPDKPSRQKCIWVCCGADNLEYWKPHLSNKKDDLFVYRVELEGVTHEASDEHLMKDDMPYEEALLMAHRYWKGEIANPLAKETLFEGRMKILELIH